MYVAPLAGAWIEIKNLGNETIVDVVAPLAGAWIEIFFLKDSDLYQFCRSPRGSVD